MNKIRIKHGDSEIEIEGSDEFISKQLADFYVKLAEIATRVPPSKIKHEILEPPSKPTAAAALTPAEFYKQKGKTDGVSQILIFGKYLEEYKRLPEFTREDINKLAQEAKLSKDIHGQYFTNAVKQGLLRTHGRGKYSLTLSAESVISSM